LQYGDVAVSFNLQPKNNILDLTPRVDELDVDLVEEVMAEHSSGVKVLATARPERAELVTGPQFSALLSYLSDIFPYVIVDTSRRLNDVTLAAIDSCDVLALVASQDIPSIWRMRKFLDMLPGLNFNPKRILMIMNQFDQRVSIDPEKVGQAFGHPVAAVIPSALNMAVNASNKGEPFMLTSGIGTQPLGRGILNFVDALKAKLEEVEKIDTQAVTR
jgi:pilus assembly protein CpaE